MDRRGAAHAHQQYQDLEESPHHHQQPPHPQPMPTSTIHQGPPTTYGPQPGPDAQAAASHPYLGTAASQGPQGPHDRNTRNTYTTSRDAQTINQHNAQPRPPHHQLYRPHTIPPRSPTRDQATDAPRGGSHQPIDCDAHAGTHHRESPLPRPPGETPSPDPKRDNDGRPPPTHTTPPITARTTTRRTGRTLRPTQPYSGTAAPLGARRPGGATPQHLGTTKRIGPTTPVQAATLGEGVRDFLFDAFLHVARHDRPPLATPDGESPPPTGSRILVPPIDWGQHLVRHPMPGHVDTKGRTCYPEPDMAHPPLSATPSDTKEWERETWVDQMASLSNFRHQVPGDVPTPNKQQPALSPYMTLMYNIHYTLYTTHYQAPTGHWLVHGTDSLLPADYAPPPANPGPDTYTREDEPADPDIWDTWERKSLDTLLYIRSGNQGLGRGMYRLAKWTQRTWGIRRDRGLWKVKLLPKRREAPTKCRGPTPPRPTTLQLCPYMVAARLMALRWPGPDTPTRDYPHLTEEDMPGIQRCVFSTLDYLQQTHPHVLEPRWTAPG